jgi:hypothetical protein
VTHEPKGPTEDFVSGTGAEYGYAYERSMKLMRALGAGGFPSAYLVDPMGVIVWEGHPAALEEVTIQRHLGGALKIPMWEWPRAAAKARKHVQKGELAKAFAVLDKAKGDDAVGVIRDDLRAMMEMQLRTMEASLEKGDVLRAVELAERGVKGLKGMPEADRAQAVLDRVDEDDECQRVLKLQKKLVKLADVEDLSRKKLLKRCEDLREFIRDAKGTYAAKSAQDLLQDLLKRAG